MRKMARTVLPFKLAATEESMTAQSGLVLLGEFAQGAGLHRWLEREMPKPGGGRSLEDLRMVHGDSALRRLLHLDRLPSSDAAGDWLRRAGESKGLAGLDRVNQRG